MAAHIAERLQAPGAKRMLALDGGGTRGIITIAFLLEIQQTLQTKLGRGDDFVLSDYFDLIGGTSVGSIIATLLALGWRVEKIEKTFRDWAPEVFRARRIRGMFAARFDAKKLSQKIREVVGNAPMSSDKLKTGLCIVAKRADTNSVWIMTNNPRSKYWRTRNGVIDNGDYQIHDLIRASTAAPTFFRRKDIPIHRFEDSKTEPMIGQFVDGAVSPHNNPSLQMFMLASIKGYNLGGAPIDELRSGNGKSWPLGPKTLLMISVGTGNFPTTVKRRWIPNLEAIDALKSMIGDAEQLTLGLMQGMAVCRRYWHVDSDIGNLATDAMFERPLLTFQRYDVRLTEKWLTGKNDGDVQRGPLVDAALCDGRINLAQDLPQMQELIGTRVMDKLCTIAAAAAKEQVAAEDFPSCFDYSWSLKPYVCRFPT